VDALRGGGAGKQDAQLTVEVSDDEAFKRVVSVAHVPVSAASDWTCRVVVGGLQAARVYWYRFTDSSGAGSRVGRTLTAPKNDDTRPVRFAFVSCQNANDGAQNAYRRMIFEDQHAPESERLGFVLHLGDFIMNWCGIRKTVRRACTTGRFATSCAILTVRKSTIFTLPTTVDDYRAVLPRLPEGSGFAGCPRAPSFCEYVGHHEFSWKGWQSLQIFDGKTRPAQTRKVAANQAFFEYQPARIRKPSGPSLERFDGPTVSDAAVSTFDEHGMGQEKNNLAAIGSLQGYRALRGDATWNCSSPINGAIVLKNPRTARKPRRSPATIFRS